MNPLKRALGALLLALSISGLAIACDDGSDKSDTHEESARGQRDAGANRPDGGRGTTRDTDDADSNAEESDVIDDPTSFGDAGAPDASRGTGSTSDPGERGDTGTDSGSASRPDSGTRSPAPMTCDTAPCEREIETFIRGLSEGATAADIEEARSMLRPCCVSANECGVSYSGICVNPNATVEDLGPGSLGNAGGVDTTRR